MADNTDVIATANGEKDQAEQRIPPEGLTKYPTGLKLVVIILALYLAVFLVALDRTVVATAIPRITDRFHSVQDIGWYATFGRIYKIFPVRYITQFNWIIP
jgi:hypothetical protein